MWFAVIWLVILAADLLFWAAYTRCCQLHLLSLRLPLLRRPLVVVTVQRPSKNQSQQSGPSEQTDAAKEDEEKTSKPFELPPDVQQRVARMLATGAVDVAGLDPPPPIKRVVTAILLVQNAIAIGTVPLDGASKAVCERAGQLAFLNTLPLVLLAFPDLALAKLVRQGAPEITWAHRVFGWLVWLNTVVHIGSSVVMTRGPG